MRTHPGLIVLNENNLARENFPNVEHYEFSETNLHSMNQLNALAQVTKLNFMVTLFHPCVVVPGAGNHLFDHWRGRKPTVCKELETLCHLQVTFECN